MYKNIFFDKKENLIHVWDDKKGYFTEDYSKYDYCYIQSNKGNYTSIYGHKLIKVNKNTLKGYHNEKSFESDIDPNVRYLLDNYGDSDESSEGCVIFYYDIEVEMITGKPDVHNPKNSVTSISTFDTKTNEYYVFVLSEDKEIQYEKEGVNLKVFETERELLKCFIDFFNLISPDIITGWNIDYFDTPYIINRSKRLLGNYANKYSQIEKVRKTRSGFYQIAGVSNLDYISIYKNFSQKELENYTLDYVSKYELGKGKVEYEGNLDELFREDINKFIEYNIVDVQLVKELEEKNKFIALSREICHLCHVPYEAIIHSSRFLEGAILTYMRRKSLIAPDRDYFKNMNTKELNKGDERIYVDCEIDERYPSKGKVSIQKTKTTTKEFEYIGFNDDYFILKKPSDIRIESGKELNIKLIGAFVKPPQAGRHKWVYSLDLRSLYPSLIRTLNMSPETKIAKILNWKEINLLRFFKRGEDLQIKTYKDFTNYSNNFDFIPSDAEIVLEFSNKDVVKMSKKEFVDIMNDNQYNIASNGVLYSSKVRGIIPSITDEWFESRMEFKRKMWEAKDKKTKEFFNQRQWIQKIFLNSLYGVMALSSFRFFDIENAEAITLTAQDTNRFGEISLTEHYKKKYDYKGDPCVYGDTDSVYYKFHNEEVTNDIEEMRKYSKKFCEVINNSMEIFAKYGLNSNENYLEYEREKICKCGFWKDKKKKYALKVADDEGETVDKISFTGLELIKSNYPPMFKKTMNDVLEMILDFEEKETIDEYITNFENSFSDLSIDEVSKRSSIKTMDEYKSSVLGLNRFKKNVPPNAKASFIYNQMLEYYKCPYKYEPIKVGDKVKIVYLKTNPFRFEYMAYKPNNNPPEIISFLEKYADRNKMYEQELKGKLYDFYDILGWDYPNKSSNDFF